MSAKAKQQKAASESSRPASAEQRLKELGIQLPATTFASANDLGSALRRAAAAHGQHEKRIGGADPNWPDWYAEYMVRERAGEELPQ